MEQHWTGFALALVVLLFAEFVTSQLSLNPPETEVYRYINSTYAVTCKDAAGRAVRWKGPRGDIGQRGHPHTSITSHGNSLMFEIISPNDHGRYFCVTDDKDSVHFNLSINRPIHFMDTPSVQTGVEFTDVNLRCEVSGDPKPDINWYVAGYKPSPPKYNILGDGLQIKNVSRHDPNNFTCTAFQVTLGLFKEKKIQLKVQHKPVTRLPLRAKVEHAWGYVHGEVNLTCDTIAEPAATFTWHRNKQKVPPNTGRVHTEGQKSILQLSIRDDSMFGQYKCVATNKLGTLEQLIVLNKGTKPLPPDSVEIKGENADHVVFTIRGPELTKNHTPKEMMPIGYRIKYKTTEETVPWKLAAFADFEKNEADEYMLENLQPDTEYEIRVATRNPAGLSDFVPHNRNQTFRTLTKNNASSAWSSPSNYFVCLNILVMFFFGVFST